MKGSAPKVHSHRSDMTPLNSRLQLALLNRKKDRNLLEKGFTLVELMIVIVIVGLLSAIALPQFLNQRTKAIATEATTQVGAISSAAHAESLESPLNATTLDGLADSCVTIQGDVDTTRFNYTCELASGAFTVTGTGVATSDAAGIVVSQTTAETAAGSGVLVNERGAFVRTLP